MFTLVSWASLGIAFICALVIAIDEIRHPQKMWIMNVVWPVTALYFSVFAIWGYFRIGRGMVKSAMPGMSMDMKARRTAQREQTERMRREPTWRQTAVSDTHCGAGCVIGDVIAEFSLFALGWTLLGSSLYAEYAGDLLLAWLLGIAFQYFAIKPMGNLSVKQAIIAAVKSDTLSILTFEFGLFGAWVRGATDADVAIIQLAMNSERSAADSASSQELRPPLAPVAKLGTGLATGLQPPRAQLTEILANLKWRRGWDSNGRSLRISMLPISQGTSFPRNPLESPHPPPNLPPQLFTQVRSNSGLGGIDISQRKSRNLISRPGLQRKHLPSFTGRLSAKSKDD